MLENIAIILLVVIILIMLLVKWVTPATPNYVGAGPQPAALPYTLEDFCAYHSHLVLSPFEEGGARFLFDVKLPDADDTIDMIMLAKSGAYVFEHAKAQGWISGMEDNEKWTQHIQVGYGGKSTERKFPNPVITVNGKTKALRKFLDNDGIHVRSIVVFPDFCLMSNIKVFNPNVRVVTLNQLLPTVVALNGKTGTNITQRDLNLLFDELVEYEVIPQEEFE